MHGPDRYHQHSPTALVVVNYGSHQLLDDGLGAVTLPADDFLVLVVDNFSTPGERSAVRDLCARRGWRLIAHPDNGGFAVGVNEGLAEALRAGCDSFVLLNPDVRPTAAVLAELRQQVRAEPDVLVSPHLRGPGGELEFAGSVVDLRSGRIRGVRRAARRGERPSAWLPATCLAFSADVLERTGPMAESYFMYWEDVDFTVRSAGLGARLVVRDDLEVLHLGGATQQRVHQRVKSNLYYRYNCRNRLVFGARNLGRRELIRWILRTPAVSWAILMQGGRRQLLQSPAPLLAMLTGTGAGLLAAARALLLGRHRSAQHPAEAGNGSASHMSLVADARRPA
jgi:GT2 family glycosyltransferase